MHFSYFSWMPGLTVRQCRNMPALFLQEPISYSNYKHVFDVTCKQFSTVGPLSRHWNSCVLKIQTRQKVSNKIRLDHEGAKEREYKSESTERDINSNQLNNERVLMAFLIITRPPISRCWLMICHSWINAGSQKSGSLTVALHTNTCTQKYQASRNIWLL